MEFRQDPFHLWTRPFHHFQNEFPNFLGREAIQEEMRCEQIVIAMRRDKCQYVRAKKLHAISVTRAQARDAVFRDPHHFPAQIDIRDLNGGICPEQTGKKPSIPSAAQHCPPALAQLVHIRKPRAFQSLAETPILGRLVPPRDPVAVHPGCSGIHMCSEHRFQQE